MQPLDVNRPLRPAAFVDRDGTIIQERHYLADPAGVELIDGAAQALRALAEAGYALVVVTNQSGIARGRIRPEQYEAVRERVGEILAAEGVTLDGVYHCPHHPEITGPCECRKPGLALYERAARELGLDLARSIYIGDKVSDVAPAMKLGGRGYLVLTGHGAEESARLPPGTFVVAADLRDAVSRVLGRTGGSGR